MSINTFLNFIYGKKNSSTFYADNNVDREANDEVVDENGFVMIDFGDRGQSRCIQVFEP